MHQVDKVWWPLISGNGANRKVYSFFIRSSHSAAAFTTPQYSPGVCLEALCRGGRRIPTVLQRSKLSFVAVKALGSRCGASDSCSRQDRARRQDRAIPGNTFASHDMLLLEPPRGDQASNRKKELWEMLEGLVNKYTGKDSDPQVPTPEPASPTGTPTADAKGSGGPDKYETKAEVRPEHRHDTRKHSDRQNKNARGDIHRT